MSQEGIPERENSYSRLNGIIAEILGPKATLKGSADMIKSFAGLGAIYVSPDKGKSKITEEDLEKYKKALENVLAQYPGDKTAQEELKVLTENND